MFVDWPFNNLFSYSISFFVAMDSNMAWNPTKYDFSVNVVEICKKLDYLKNNWVLSICRL